MPSLSPSSWTVIRSRNIWIIVIIECFWWNWIRKWKREPWQCNQVPIWYYWKQVCPVVPPYPARRVDPWLNLRIPFMKPERKWISKWWSWKINFFLKIPFRDGFTLDELSRSIQRMNDEDKCFLRCRVICGFDDSGHTSSLSVNDEKQDVGRLFGLVLLFDQFRTPLRHLLLVTNVLFIYYVTAAFWI